MNLPLVPEGAPQPRTGYKPPKVSQDFTIVIPPEGNVDGRLTAPAVESLSHAIINDVYRFLPRSPSGTPIVINLTIESSFA